MKASRVGLHAPSMKELVALLLTLLAARASAHSEQGWEGWPSTSHPVVLEKDASLELPQGWSVQGPSPPEQQVNLVFAVRQTNVKQLEVRMTLLRNPGYAAQHLLSEKLLHIADPKSYEYGRHLTNEQVHDLIAPEPNDVDAVLTFLFDNGVTNVKHVTPNSDFLQATVTIKQAEALLSTTYEQMLHEPSGVVVNRCTRTGYKLPASLAALIDFVAPTIRLPSLREKPKENACSRRQGDDTSDAKDPKTLRDLYGVDGTQGYAPNNKQAVTAFDEQYYSEDALQDFLDAMCVPDGITCGVGNSASQSVTTAGDAGQVKGSGAPILLCFRLRLSVMACGLLRLAKRAKGPQCRSPTGTEAMLDIEYITALGANIKSEFWGFSGHSPDSPEEEPWLKWLTLVSSTDDAEVRVGISHLEYKQDVAEQSQPEPRVERATLRRSPRYSQQATVRQRQCQHWHGRNGSTPSLLRQARVVSRCCLQAVTTERTVIATNT
eukprot:scaffold910_cov396-Prasinococcus_capsulatus_cf.AAC.57